MVGMDNDHGAAAAKVPLRTCIRDRRAAVDPEERSRRDDAAVDHLLRMLDSPPAGTPDGVAAFMGLPGEPGGSRLTEALHDTGNPVWLPVVSGRARPLSWLPYQGRATMRRGAFGIREPGETPEFPSAISTMELSALVHTLVVPALAVGNDGIRLGQGGGFYDRTLAEMPSHLTVIAFIDHEEFGLDVPATALDVPVHHVVTDEGAFPTPPPLT